MEQLGRTGLRQRAASAAYDVLIAILFNIIHIVFLSKMPENEKQIASLSTGLHGLVVW
jgi:hypothetical protein